MFVLCVLALSHFSITSTADVAPSRRTFLLSFSRAHDISAAHAAPASTPRPSPSRPRHPAGPGESARRSAAGSSACRRSTRRTRSPSSASSTWPTATSPPPTSASSRRRRSCSASTRPTRSARSPTRQARRRRGCVCLLFSYSNLWLRALCGRTFPARPAPGILVGAFELIYVCTPRRCSGVSTRVPTPLPIPARPVPGTLVGAFEFVVFGVSMLLFTTDRLLTTSSDTRGRRRRSAARRRRT